MLVKDFKDTKKEVDVLKGNKDKEKAEKVADCYKPKNKTVKGFTFEAYPSNNISDDDNDISSGDEVSGDDDSEISSGDEDSGSDTPMDEADGSEDDSGEEVESDEGDGEKEEVEDKEENECTYEVYYDWRNRPCVKANIPYHLMTEKQKKGIMSRLYCLE